MYTQCPECLTIYRIPVDALTRAHGRARCGVCRAEFDALATLVDHLPPEPVGQLERHTPGPLPILDVPAMRPKAGQHDLFAPPPEEEEEVAPAPTFVQPPAPKPRGSRVLRYANVLLFLGLLAQAAYAGRGWWMNEPRLRPWLDAVCLRLDCRLPPRADLSQIALVSRDVRPHPSQSGALIISATMLNRAAFTQPYPIVEITLSDLDEQRIAMRRVAPQDYLVDARALARGLAPNATATIDLEVQDPGRNAVAFEFKFR
jgi:predicted Zn finger-like uncharacterized protein